MMNIIKKDIIQYGGIESYLYNQQYKTLLRFLTCGGVDDGKTTLIGRLLYDTKHIYEDQLSAVDKSCDYVNLHKNKSNLALLVDGLQLERIQGITIDVSYRFFFTQKRKFIIIDTPGHEEYTKNMVTGASHSDLAILLVDACKGICNQTRRHWFISSLMGIKHIIVAINKMDLINYDKNIFQEIVKKYLEFNSNELFTDIDTKFIPISALNGDNIIASSLINMPWYCGPTLFDMLENTKINSSVDINNQKLRFPIQYVIRSSSNVRIYAGTIASGSMNIGQKIKVFPSNTVSKIKNIFNFNKDKICAVQGESIAINLENDIDVGRGDILLDYNQVVSSTQNALVDIVWMKQEDLQVGQLFDVKLTTKIIRVRIKHIYYQIDMNTFRRQESDVISYNGVGLIELLFEESWILDKYLYYPITGSMIFIDILSNETVGAGMIKNPMKQYSVLNNKKYSEFELALHAFIRFHFPHWNVHNLL